MGKTTFTGPIRAGSIINTSGTTLGQDVRNVGSVVMAQVVPVTQAGSTTATGTNIVLPANSHVLDIHLLATTAWTAGISIGTSVASTELVGVTAAPVIGINTLTPGADATRSANWDDTGTTDRRVFVLSAATGIGVGTLVVRYIQAHDLP